MEKEIIQIIKDFSIPATVALVIIFAWPYRLILRDWILKKINPDMVDYATLSEIKEHIKTGDKTSEAVMKIGSNHLHEISETLKRIEDKMDRMNDSIIYIKAKVNGGK